MDARKLSLISGIEVGTLNVWVQRGLIPGMTVGARGRQRDFSVEVATDVMIMGELARLGFEARQASFIVATRPDRDSKLLLIGKHSAFQPTPIEGAYTAQATVIAFGFERERDLPKGFRERGVERPSAYVVIDVRGISGRLKQVEREWQGRQKAKSGD